jgi:phosphoribosylanthranilate isomerase
MEPIIQIAGIVDQEESDLLVQCGVTHLGFSFRLPVHKEDITEEEAATLIGNLEPPTQAVLITYLDTVEEIISLVGKLGAGIVQLHGDIDKRDLGRLRMKKPDLMIWKSMVVGAGDAGDLEIMVTFFQDLVDAFITDTYDPDTGASGATGKTHDWNVSRRLVQLSEKPVILAGGLTPGNVKQAILDVGPAGVDAHTGVEGSDGRKIKELVEAFVTQAREGFRLRR